MPRRLARKCLQGEKAAFTLCSHRTPRHGRCIRESGDDNSRTQRDDRAQTDGARLGAGLGLLSTPGPSARFGRTTGACSVQCDGPGWRGASITSRSTARSCGTAAAALAGAAAARAYALRPSDRAGANANTPGPRPSACSAARSVGCGTPLAATEASAGPLRKVMRGFAAQPQPTPPRPGRSDVFGRRLQIRGLDL
jgi:hypothetical protein